MCTYHGQGIRNTVFHAKVTSFFQQFSRVKYSFLGNDGEMKTRRHNMIDHGSKNSINNTNFKNYNPLVDRHVT